MRANRSWRHGRKIPKELWVQAALELLKAAPLDWAAISSEDELRETLEKLLSAFKHLDSCTMPLLHVCYRFFDRDSGHTGEGNALVRLDGRDVTGQQDLGCDDPEQRQWIERYVAEAIANAYPQHQPERLVVLLTRCIAAHERH